MDEETRREYIKDQIVEECDRNLKLIEDMDLANDGDPYDANYVSVNEDDILSIRESFIHIKLLLKEKNV